MSKPKYEYSADVRKGTFMNLGAGDIIIDRWEGVVKRRRKGGKWEVIARPSVQQSRQGALRVATKRANDYKRYFDHHGSCWHDEKQKERARKKAAAKEYRRKAVWAQQNMDEIIAVISWSAKGKPHEAKAQRLLEALKTTEAA